MKVATPKNHPNGPTIARDGQTRRGLVSRARLGCEAEIGGSEAKVLGDLPEGISPTASRSY
jgi:hypothetical protein